MPSPKLWLARSRRKTGVPRLLRETEFPIRINLTLKGDFEGSALQRFEYYRVEQGCLIRGPKTVDARPR